MMKEQTIDTKELCCSMYELVQYEPFIDINKTIDIINGFNTITTCVIFKHDHEENDKIHYHIYIKLQTALKVSYIAKVLSQPIQYFQKIKKRFNNCIQYGTHKNAPSKFQYDLSSVIYEKNYDVKAYYSSLNRQKELNDLILKLAENSITLNDFKNLISTEEYLNNFSKIEKARKLQSENFTNSNRNIKVYTITGLSGCGKTTLAKWLCEKNNLTFYISSSGQNFMDDYNGEDVLILDDFRGSQVCFSDLLKLLDNNTSSMVRARYHNKHALFKYVIITSVYSPNCYYSSDILRDEPLKQLMRRINKNLIILQDGYAYEWTYDEKHNSFIINNDIPVFNVVNIINEISQKNNVIEDLF